MPIYKALLKYDHSNFKLEILEYCDKENVISREQHYLDLLGPEYNILTEARSSLGYKHTEETLDKFKLRKDAFSEEMRSKLSVAARQNSFAALPPTGGRVRNLGLAPGEARSGGRSANWVTIEVTNLETGEKVNYTSARAVAKAIGGSHNTVLKYLELGKVYKKVYSFAYKN